MKLRWYWGVLLGLSVVLSGMSTGQAKGEQPYNYKEDYKKALRTAPQGILVKDIFERGDPQDNQAAVVPVTNDEVKATTEAVMITNDKNQYGTIWSTAANKFKLKHDRVASMWMYFGGNRGAAADGMALVLQNDQRRGNAKSVYRDHPFGEPLGVWGVDDDKELRDAQGLAKRVIQNSWALEFDTHLNNSDNLRSAGTADSFDIGLKGPHIAAAYPGEASSYQQHSGVRYNMDRVFYYHLVHQKPIDQLSLADGQWHHVTLSWQAADPEDPQKALPQMTYTFDDKDPETNVDRPGYTRTVPVDPKIIDPTGSGETMWGFTGATGEAAANNLVIFEGVPGLVDISAHTELTNLTTNRVVRDGDRLKNGDRVRLQYQLTYQGGKLPWQQLKVQLKLPANLKFTQGAVTYDVDEAQVIPAASFQKDQVTFELASTLDQFNPTATVTLEGRATTGMRPTTSTATRGSFTAANGVATTAVPGLTVTPVYDLGLALASDATVEVLAGDVPEIRGRVTLPDQAGLTAQDLQVYPTINGKELAPVSLASLIDPSTGNLRYRPAEGELAAGPNTVSLRVQDQYGNVSAPIRVRVEVIGTLSFDTLKTASFRATKLTGQAQATIPPTGDWDVRVLDTRRANSRWQLQLAASPFRTAKGERLAGGLSYTDKEKTTQITTTPQTVYRGMARTQQPVTNVTATWKAGMGLHLDLSGNALPGDYQADLYWSLNDVPNP